MKKLIESSGGNIFIGSLIVLCLIAMILFLGYNDHYDIVIKPGLITIHTSEYKIDDHYICTPTKCIPRSRVKEIRTIRNCQCKEK